MTPESEGRKRMKGASKVMHKLWGELYAPSPALINSRLGIAKTIADQGKNFGVAIEIELRRGNYQAAWELDQTYRGMFHLVQKKR